jgi:hypothetical protein
MPHKSEFYMLGEIPTHANRCRDSNSFQKTLAATEYVSAAILLSFPHWQEEQNWICKNINFHKEPQNKSVTALE